MRRIVISILLASMLASDALCATGASEAAVERKLRVFMQEGFFAGDESGAHAGYSVSHVRAFYELGLKLTNPRSSEQRLEEIALGVSIAGSLDHIWGAGGSDARLAFGPTVSWRLAKDWTFSAMAGPAMSSKRREFGIGLQMRSYATYRNSISFDVLAQELSQREQYGSGGGPRISSLYAGVAFHGNWAKYEVYVTIALGLLLIIFGYIWLAVWAASGDHSFFH